MSDTFFFSVPPPIAISTPFFISSLQYCTESHIKSTPWSERLSWLEHRPICRKSFGLNLGSGQVEKATDGCVWLSVPFSLPLLDQTPSPLWGSPQRRPWVCVPCGQGAAEWELQSLWSKDRLGGVEATEHWSIAFVDGEKYCHSSRHRWTSDSD